MTPSRDLVSHHIQQHSTKSTDRTYLSPYSYRPTYSIHQTPFIYCWESAFLHRIVEKRTSRHSIVGTRSSSPSSYDCWVSELRWMWDHLEPTNYQPPIEAVVVASQWKSVLPLEATGLLEVVKSWWRGARPAGRSRSGSLREPGIFWVWLQRVVRSLE